MAIKTLLKPWELVTALLLAAILAIVLIPYLVESRLLHRQELCQDNLRRLSIAMNMYAAEAPGNLYPPLKVFDCAGEPNPNLNWIFDVESMFPEYLVSLDVLVCPSNTTGESAGILWDEGKTTNPAWTFAEGFTGNGKVDPCEVVSGPYYYYGYALKETTFGPDYFDSVMHAFTVLADSLQTEVEMNGKAGDYSFLHRDLDVDEPMYWIKTAKVQRLQSGIHRYLYDWEEGPRADYAALSSDVVLLHESVVSENGWNHGRPGANVLYTDGHVEFVSWDPSEDDLAGQFPFNRAGIILYELRRGISPDGVLASTEELND